MKVSVLAAGLVGLATTGVFAFPFDTANTREVKPLLARNLPTVERERWIIRRADDDDDDDDDSDDSESEDSSKTSKDKDQDDKSSDNDPPQVTQAPSSGPSTPASSGGKVPPSSGTSTLAAAHTIAAGQTFDGGMKTIDRGVSCTGQKEGGDSDAVFQIQPGGTLANVIIGPNQIEGVHCQGDCTLKNVWWSAVCEDAFTVKKQDAGQTTTITGGGAFGAEDKVLQHNGGGTLQVSGFTVDDFGKLYRSCGNCKEMPTRHVVLDDISASSGSTIVGINSNYGDTAKLSNIKVKDVKDICVRYTGNTSGDEPTKNGSGPDGKNCLYQESDVTQL